MPLFHHRYITVAYCILSKLILLVASASAAKASICVVSGAKKRKNIASASAKLHWLLTYFNIRQ